MVKRRIIGILSMRILLLSSCSFTSKDNSIYTNDEYEKLLEEATTTPYGKYPELITYTLGKMSGNNNSNMPEGDTYENNAYTRYLKENLNIQNLDAFEEKDDQYFITVNMAISAGEIPDIMLVQDAESVVALAERGLIEDLTKSYDNCASDVIKEIYNSYGNDIFEGVTIDGKLMAIPETNISDGPNLIWLRKDWMDKLGLDPPKNVEDLVNIIRQFILQNPGDNEENETIGIVCDTDRKSVV